MAFAPEGMLSGAKPSGNPIDTPAKSVTPTAAISSELPDVVLSPGPPMKIAPKLETDTVSVIGPTSITIVSPATARLSRTCWMVSTGSPARPVFALSPATGVHVPDRRRLGRSVRPLRERQTRRKEQREDGKRRDRAQRASHRVPHRPASGAAWTRRIEAAHAGAGAAGALSGPQVLSQTGRTRAPRPARAAGADADARARSIRGRVAVEDRGERRRNPPAGDASAGAAARGG